MNKIRSGREKGVVWKRVIKSERKYIRTSVVAEHICTVSFVQVIISKALHISINQRTCAGIYLISQSRCGD